MKLRNARRLSRRLKHKHKGIDIVKFVLSKHQLLYSQVSKKYFIRWRGSNSSFIRHHRCSFRLCSIVYTIMKVVPPRDQGTDTWDSSEQLTLPKIEFEYVGVAHDVRPNLKLDEPHIIDKEVEKIVLEAVTKKLDHRVIEEKYTISPLIKDRLDSIVKVGTRPSHPADEIIQFMAFVRATLDSPKSKELLKTNVDLSYEEQSRVAAQNTSGGFVPVKGLGGSKKQMQAQALICNEHDLYIPRPNVLPHKCFIKDEMLKVGKQPRAVQIQSQCDYVIDSLLYSDDNRVPSGSAIGVAPKTGGFQRLYMNWFFHYKDVTGKGWDDFIEYLKTTGAHESDKTGWEASTNENDGLPYFFDCIGKYGNVSKSESRLVCRSWASTICPLISVGNHWGFYAPWRIASGDKRTSAGNTKRHQMMNWVISDLALLRRCGCIFCLKSGELKKVSKLEWGLRNLAMVMGDDYGAPSWGEGDAIFDQTMDHYFGTVTKTDTKQFFSPSADKIESFAFLRNQFELSDDNVILSYRNEERIYAKLYWKCRFKEAEGAISMLKSLMYEAGSNAELFEWLRNLCMQIKRSVKAGDERDLKDSEIRAPLFTDVEPCLIHHDDIMNVQSQFARYYVRAVRETADYLVGRQTH